MKRAVRHRSIALALPAAAITGLRAVLMRSLLRVMKSVRQQKGGPSPFFFNRADLTVALDDLFLNK